jgi:GWxTD domain-containing protein
MSKNPCICCRAILAAAVIGLSASFADGQELTLPACAPTAPHFCADVAYFYSDGSPVLNVYYNVCNEGLQFIKTGGGFRASADVLVVLLDEKKRQVAGDTYRVRLRASRYEETTSVDSCVTRILSFKARAGDYSMALSTFDGDSQRKSTIEARIQLPSYDNLPALSDLAFLCVGDEPGTSRWNGLIPNVKRVYDTAKEDVRFYYEVYHPESGDSVVIGIQVLDGTGQTLYETSGVSAGTGRTTHLDRLPSEKLSNGRYVLRLVMMGSNGEPRAERVKEFEVVAESFYFGRDADVAMALLTYVASNSLIEAFADADTANRKRIWQQFWREKDPTPGTPKNEFYDEHLRRFRYANDRFTTSLTEGWRTDRGRIYIMYGEPDEIETYPIEVGRNPMEIWYYFSRGRRFIFVDETGFGDYTLVREQ